MMLLVWTLLMGMMFSGFSDDKIPRMHSAGNLLSPKYVCSPACFEGTTSYAVQSNNDTNGLYIGMIVAPEFSKVGSQTRTKAGYHAGFLFGYRFNLKFNVESGMMMGKRRYHSDGKYFSTSRVSAFMPAGSEIITVNGQSTQIEFPIAIKYDIVQRKNSEFFFKAGLLSHIYLREKIHYQTTLNGVGGRQTGIYNDDHLALVSQMQISAGYEHRLRNFLSVRIEPYKNIPFGKTGIGSLRVFSSGFNIGLLRDVGRSY